MSPDQPSPPDVVTETREETLNAYRAKPIQICSDGNRENEERREYAKRTILELLQNVEDALSDGERQGGFFIRLVDRELIVANEGAPFTDRGFRALCTLNYSGKQAHMDRERPRRMIGSKGTGFKSVLNWTDRIELFSGRIAARFDRTEAATKIRQKIGKAGVDKIEEDGPWPDDRMPLLQVPLSPEPDTQSDAQIQVLVSEGWSTIFRFRLLPDKLKLTEVQEALANIDPRQWLFLDKLSRIKVSLDGLLTDWRLDRREHRSSSDNTRCYQLYINKDGHPVAHYQVIRRLLPDSVRPTKSDEVGLAEIGFAYQVDGDDAESAARVANFFATDCLSPFPAIAVHGTFLLKADRSRLAEDDLSYQRTLINALSELLRERLIPGLVSQYGPGALYYLAPRPSNSSGESNVVEAELQQRLVHEVKSTAFVRTIAGSVTAPRDLKLWHHGLGNLLETNPLAAEITGLPHPHWCNGDTSTILCDLGASTLTPREHIRALLGWQPTSPEIAGNAHDTLAQTYQEICWPRYEWKDVEREKKSFINLAHRLTIWRVADGAYRALADSGLDSGAFFEPRADKPTLPNFIRADWLETDFQASLKKRKLWDTQVSRDVRLGQLHGHGRDELLKHAVIPAVEENSHWWLERGNELLLALHSLGCEANETSDVHESLLRKQLGQHIWVPTRHDGWQPADRVYAGADWDNPWAENFVARSDSQRFLLGPPEQLPYGKNIAPVLRFIGVSWTPKWRRHLDDSNDYGTWPKDYASLDAPPNEFSGLAGWPSYWSTVGRLALQKSNQGVATGTVGRWPLVDAWAIEGLEEFIGGLEGIAAGLRALRELWELKAHLSRRKIIVGRRGPNGAKIKKINQFESTPADSFIAWQIKNSRLFSVEPSPLFPDGSAALCDLLIGSGSHGAWLKWLPRPSLAGCDPSDTRDLEAFALDFGARASVNDYSLDQWRGWLSMLAGWPFGEPPINELHGFLGALSRLEAKADGWSRDTRLPCVAADETLVFSPLSELTILDEPRFEGFRSALLMAGHRLLLASVRDGRRLLQMFGREDRAVSALVRLDVAEHRPCGSAQERLRWCECVRSLVLAWFDHAGGPTAAARLRDGWPREIRAHRPLQVNVALTVGGTLGCIDQPFLWVGDILHVGAGEGAGLWDHVAEGLNQKSKLDKLVEDGIVRLLQAVEAAKSPEAGIEFLRIKGIAPDELQRWDQEGPISPEAEPLPSQPPLPQVVTVTNLELRADANTETPVDAQPPKAPSRPAIDRDEHLPTTLPKASSELHHQPTSWTATHRSSPTQTPRTAPVADPETDATPVPIPAVCDAPQAPSPSRHRGQEPQQQGQKAEAWLHARLDELIGGAFEIKLHHRDDFGETDLVIFAAGLEILHIEVKLMTKKSIYWSFGEICKAQFCARREIPYALVILIPEPNEASDTDAGDLSFRVKWISEPVSRLAGGWIDGRVRGEWRWKKLKVPSQTLQALAAWVPSTPPAAEAPSITFVIELGDGDYVGSGLDFVWSLLKVK
ncbi:sacsin N-terminal ATP-binding-like domain-containing protein [Candidatus Thiodictyon syntrophicum]|jgi:hypothetical protein|uniref:Protein NO VEIN C-terminal domain-containing protein n=1 Tax=Candidatus Thiodictyon syntrophicum TaxID=1166950 RepID=A0A2K8UI42_9GAMM|nr:hypothetical protein [Candidatus Thiodictyon syntrophicum]AUB85192.1 hypothetical protein THSYN_30200 [Candidatus Thiodictyon syntrophicum]